MYEFTLTKSVNNAILNLCRQSGWDRVRHIVLKIGGMRKVNPELMSSAFDVISQGTRTEGASFSIMTLPTTFRCRACGRDSQTENTTFACPLCGSRDVELLSGLELAIEFLEVEKSPPGDAAHGGA